MTSDLVNHASSVREIVATTDSQLAMMRVAMGSLEKSGSKVGDSRRHTMGSMNQIRLQKAARTAAKQKAVADTKEKVMQLHAMLPPIDVHKAVAEAVDDELSKPNTPISSPTPREKNNTLAPIAAH